MDRISHTQKSGHSRAIDGGEYKHVALGLLFLRYVSAAFDLKRAEFMADDLADPEDPEEYLAENVFRVPEPARWSRLSAISKSPEIGVEIDAAMRAIEEANPTLKDALPKVYGRESLDRGIVSGLIDLFTNMPFEGSRADFDLIGRVYEYCIGEFASAEGKRNGEFYTPKSVVETLVKMIGPTQGRVYDPCCEAASSCSPSGSSATTGAGSTTSRSTGRSATTPPIAPPA